MPVEQLSFPDDEQGLDVRRAWERVLLLLRTRVTNMTYDAYLKGIRPISFEDGRLVLGVAGAFAREWLEKRYSSIVRSACEEIFATTVEVKYQVLAPSERTEPARSSSRRSAEVAAAQPQRPARLRVPDLSDPINEAYTFDRFVVGVSNRFAHAACEAVASAPGQEYNPLFIYGSSGLGKTHLLHAIANHARKLQPDIRVALVAAESFLQLYVTALRERSMEDFRAYFRSVDLWLLDDVQLITSKEHTREEVFHTFNALHGAQKQVVIASDKPPRELREADDRLRTRLEWGLIADISSPALEVRLAILQQRCRQEGWQIPELVLYHIADSLQSNCRALEGALTRLVAYSSVMGTPIDIDLAQNVLTDYFIDSPVGGTSHKKTSLDMIVRAVGERLHVTPESIRSQRRDKQVLLARQVACYLGREMTGLSLSQIGDQLGGRDHTTVQRAITRMEELLRQDAALRSMVLELRSRTNL